MLNGLTRWQGEVSRIIDIGRICQINLINQFVGLSGGEVITLNNGMFAPGSGNGPASPSSRAGSTFTVIVDRNGFTMGKGQKLTAFGNIRIQAGGQTVTLGDLTSTGHIDVTASSILIQTRILEDNFTNVLVNGVLTKRREFLVDYVAKSGIDFRIGDGNDPLPVSPASAFASDTGFAGVGVGNKIFGRFENPERVVPVAGITSSIFAAPGSSGGSARLLPLDLSASSSPTNVASALAGAIPRTNREREVTQAIVLSAFFNKTLENMQLFTRPLDPQSLEEFLIGRALYQDVPQTLNPLNIDRKVTLNRLAPEPVLRTVQAYCDLAYEDGAAAYDAIVKGQPPAEPRFGALAKAVEAAWDGYVTIVGEASATGVGFRSHLESMGDEGNEGEKTALMALNKARVLLERVDEIGLSPRERQQVREAILNNIGGLTVKDIESAVVGRKLAMRTP